jgi:Xaa-Pro aminopeptidase
VNLTHLLLFQRRLDKLKVKACWINHQPDLFYLSGFGAESCWGIVGRKKAYMIVPALAQEQAASIVKNFSVVAVKKGSEIPALIADLCRKEGWTSVGYDPGRATEAEMNRLRKLSGKIRWIPVSGVTAPLRIKKDILEIRAMRRAGHVALQGFEYLRKIARSGMRECDLAGEFERYIRKNGATKASFDTIVAAGANSAYPHYITGNQIMRKNEVVLCDLGCQVDGYCSDLTRTFFLGNISLLGRKVYDTVAQAQRLAIQAVKPGVKTAQIDRIARDEIERAGYGRHFIHSTGHGVGIEVHEPPWVGSTSADTLEPGMVITVEPGVYLKGWGGVRIEDTLLVTVNGYEILTK